MLKSSGPRIEPCGIPVVILAQSDLVLLNKTYCISPVIGHRTEVYVQDCRNLVCQML